jgi:hypothetical protein
MRLVPDTEYWIGFRMKVDVEASSAYNRSTWNWFVFGWVSSATGAPEFYLNLQGTTTFSYHVELSRYKDETGATISPHKLALTGYAQDTWVEVVIHLLAKPYSLGTYVNGVVGQANPGGIAQMWIDDTLVYDQQNVYVGTDREHRGEDNDLLKMGLYNGQEGDTTAQGFINLYLDDLRIYLGENGYSIVDPSP